MMLNQIVLIGKLNSLPVEESNNTLWKIRIENEDGVFPVYVWKGVADVLAEKEVGTLIAIKGKLTNTDDVLTVVAERVSLITEGEE